MRGGVQRGAEGAEGRGGGGEVRGGVQWGEGWRGAGLSTGSLRALLSIDYLCTYFEN